MKKYILFLFTFTTIAISTQAESNIFTTQFTSARIHWNPHYAFTTTEAQIFTALHEGLVIYHPATLKPTPGAAESWEVSEDGLEITFHLRDKLRWSNGDWLTSTDFKESWIRILSPEVGAEYGSLLDDVRGARQYRTGTAGVEGIGLETPDTSTLVIHLIQPSPQFFSILCHYSFAPIHRDFRELKDWSALRSIPVNGPYVIRARDISEVYLERNQNYWDVDNVAVEKLRFLFSDDIDTIMERFNRFEIDWVISGMDASQLGVPEALNVSPQFSTTYYYFSNTNTVWADGRIRRALNLLLPWEEIRENRLIPGTSLVPPIPNYPAVTAGFPETEQRQKEALMLLEEAGYPGGTGLPNLKIRVPMEDPVAETMQNIWTEQLGMQVEISVVSFPDYYNTRKQDTYDIATLTWTGDYADPQTFLGMWNTESSFNEAHFSDSRYDEILKESTLLPHIERLTKLKEAEEILIQSCQVMPVEHFPAINLIDRRFVEGWFPNALDIHPFKNLVPRLGYKIPGVVRAP